MSQRAQPLRHPSAGQHQRGVTLIELMVALTISAILAAGAVQIFRSARGGFHTNEAVARVQENGRFGVEFLASQIRGSTGGTGCAEEADLNSTLNSDPDINFSGPSLQGSEGGGINLITHTGASDSFTVRGTDPSISLDLQSNMPNVSARLDAGPAGASQVEVGDILMVTDCNQADVFQVTNFNGNALVHNAGSPPSGGPGNSTQMLSKSYTTAAQIAAAYDITYRLRQDGDGNPQLVRVRNGNVEPLVDGVVDMQVVYGEDTDNDDVPNAYLRADDVSDWGRVLAIRARLTVRSEQQNVSPSPVALDFDGDGTTEDAPDNRLYEIFTVTASIRNRLP